VDCVVGVDIGGTRTKVVALQAADGPGARPLAEEVLPTPPDVADRFVEHVRACLALVAADHRVTGLGVVVPGLVDDRTGTAVWSANLGWRDLALRELATRAAGPGGSVAVAVGHDVRAGLVGEHRFGAARDEPDVLFVALGTGLASALLVDGALVVGSPWSGEIGHVVVRPGGPRCGCGTRGCLEAIVGAGALARRWQEITGRAGDARVVAEQAAAGEPVAVLLWDEAIDALGAALAPVVAATGTRLVLVGGGLSNAGARLIDPLTATLHARLPGQQVRVLRAGLGDRAAALGAAALALDELARPEGGRR
jgi:glucokinase